MKKAFTLVELLIVVAILGILSAIILPTFHGQTIEAKESAAKDSLRLLRQTIEIYAAKHADIPPGYFNNDPTQNASYLALRLQLTINENYLSKLPKNPLNEITTILMINNDQDFPEAPALTDSVGWIYKPATKTIKLNYEGTDSKGVAYFDY